MELLRSPALLIANPGARRGARLVERVAGAAREAEVALTIERTAGPGHGGRIAAERAGDFAAVLSLGGDGTAIEIINAMRGSATPVGVLAGGTGNLVARSLGVPFDVRRALPMLLAGEETLVDMGVLGDSQRFLFTLGIGVDAAMIAHAPPGAKRRYGVAAYVVPALRAIVRRRAFRVTILVDGETVERDATSVMIANFGSVLDDLIRLGPGIEMDDGKLDLCIFSPTGGRDAVAIAWRLLRKNFAPHPGMLYRSGRRFRISCEPAQRVQTDGEMRGETPVEVWVEPRAARLLRPRIGA